MAEIKLTKSELRLQQNRLVQLQKYLPTLQLKKAMLQAVVNEVRQEIANLEEAYQKRYREVEGYGELLSEEEGFDPEKIAKVAEVQKQYENIAGIEVPTFRSLTFSEYHYNLFNTPPWLEAVIGGVRLLAEDEAKIEVAKEKKAALEKELRDVSIRVNLFEKRLIPRALRNIKKIKIFLGDLQLAAVSQAKVAKTKIEERKAANILSQSKEDVYAH